MLSVFQCKNSVIEFASRNSSVSINTLSKMKYHLKFIWAVHQSEQSVNELAQCTWGWMWIFFSDFIVHPSGQGWPDKRGLKCFTNYLHSSHPVPIKIGCLAGQEDQFPVLPW